MKLLYVNNKNANIFKNDVKSKDAFVKYFSPSCPACIAMEEEWDDMCKDINEKYNTDMILAQMDPSGMKELDETEVHTDVDFVPTIVILKNGKKYKEYNGDKKKDEMINFLIKENLLTPKMKGGKKKGRKNKYIKGGASIKNDIINMDKEEKIKHSVKAIDNVLRENDIVNLSKKYDANDLEFRTCIMNGMFNNCINDCRISKGLNGYCIPYNRKYNPSSSTDSKETAINGYKFLLIQTILDQEAIRHLISDYGLINIPRIQEKIIQQILEKKSNYEEIDNVEDIVKYVLNVVIMEINNSSQNEIGKVSNISEESAYNALINKVKVGGKKKRGGVVKTKKGNKGKRRSIKKCIGKRDGKKGCRTCCKKYKKKYKKCITKCMKSKK